MRFPMEAAINLVTVDPIFLHVSLRQFGRRLDTAWILAVGERASMALGAVFVDLTRSIIGSSSGNEL